MERRACCASRTSRKSPKYVGACRIETYVSRYRERGLTEPLLGQRFRALSRGTPLAKGSFVMRVLVLASALLMACAAPPAPEANGYDVQLYFDGVPLGTE